MSAHDLAERIATRVCEWECELERPVEPEEVVGFVRSVLAASPELAQVREALVLLDGLKRNCQGDIGWRGLPNAIVDDYRVKHVLAVERALATLDRLTGKTT